MNQDIICPITVSISSVRVYKVCAEGKTSVLTMWLRSDTLLDSQPLLTDSSSNHLSKIDEDYTDVSLGTGALTRHREIKRDTASAQEKMP